MKQFKMKLPAGWYPQDQEHCVLEIQSYLSGFKSGSQASRGGILPHAGWDYSGKLAARVLNQLALNQPSPDVVCLVGGHLASYHPVLFVEAESAQTPLGPLVIQQELTRLALSDIVEKMEDPNEGDNTLEILFPMVKYFFPDSPVMAFRAPVSSLAEDLGESLGRLAQRENLNLLVLASADLTHYGPNYNFMPKGVGQEALEWVKMTNDREIIDLALAGKSREVWQHGKERLSSCSSGAMACAVAYGVASDGKFSLLDYYTSHDVYPSTSFVGYAGIVF